MTESSELALYARAAVRVAVASGAGVLAFAMYRDICRREPWLTRVVAAGFLLRAIGGLALFWISYLQLPILTQLQQGAGFWHLAPDARLYFDLAAGVAESGLDAMPHAPPSPGYVLTLATWMWLVGSSPASALLLNLMLYVLVCFLLTRCAVSQTTIARWGIVTPVFAISFSPALILVSTQSLKDVFFLTLVAVACLSWLWIVGAVDSGSRRWLWRLVAGFAALGAWTFLLSSIRPYYGLFLFGAAVVGLAALVVHNHRRLLSPGGILAAAGGLSCVYIAFMLGAGPYYVLVSPQRFLPQTSAAPATTGIDTYREGFIQSGGNTNIVRAEKAATRRTATESAGERHAAGEVSAKSAGTGKTVPESAGERMVERMKDLALGMAALVVPISLLKAISIVEFRGGTAFLLITDVDTVFMFVMLAASIAITVMLKQRGMFSAPVAAFAGSLGLATGLAMAYVVTNYGTVFRLRLMAMAPLWVLSALLVSRGGGRTTTTSAPVLRTRRGPLEGITDLPPAAESVTARDRTSQVRGTS